MNWLLIGVLVWISVIAVTKNRCVLVLVNPVTRKFWNVSAFLDRLNRVYQLVRSYHNFFKRVMQLQRRTHNGAKAQLLSRT